MTRAQVQAKGNGLEGTGSRYAAPEQAAGKQARPTRSEMREGGTQPVRESGQPDHKARPEYCPVSLLPRSGLPGHKGTGAIMLLPKGSFRTAEADRKVPEETAKAFKPVAATEGTLGEECV